MLARCSEHASACQLDLFQPVLITLPLCAQSRALLTYIRRIYFPFLLRDPKDVHRVDDLACVIWLYLHEGNGVLGAAIVLPSLDLLPEALPLVTAAAQSSSEYAYNLH